jgi:hypothetical protein
MTLRLALVPTATFLADGASWCWRNTGRVCKVVIASTLPPLAAEGLALALGLQRRRPCFSLFTTLHYSLLVLPRPNEHGLPSCMDWSGITLKTIISFVHGALALHDMTP